MDKNNPTLKILIVEDSPIDRRILESMLSESAKTLKLLKSVDTLAGAMRLLAEHEFNVVILDLNLPDSEGEGTLARLSSKYPEVAIVINTGAYEDEMDLHTPGAGAQDFLMKGKYTAYVLNKAIHYALERKRLERELTSAYDRLKEAQAMLVQMEKMRVIGALASGVAHEIKNPLATILHGITYLRDQAQSPDEKVRMVLANIKEAIDKANNIINDLLDFSAVPKVDRRREDLNRIIEKTLFLINHEFEKKHIAVLKRFDQAIPMVEIDKNRIEQVLLNVMLNAVQAVSDGGKVEIKTHWHALSVDLSEVPHLPRDKFIPGQTVVVCDVEDNGQGIPPARLKEIFDPFFTTKQDSGGTGLGLSISKGIMESHHGDIFIENKQGGGTRARLVFRSASDHAEG
jgi:signal transduction histidine kinase